MTLIITTFRIVIVSCFMILVYILRHFFCLLVGDYVTDRPIFLLDGGGRLVAYHTLRSLACRFVREHWRRGEDSRIKTFPLFYRYFFHRTLAVISFLQLLDSIV